jgi:hypothetical protein
MEFVIGLTLALGVSLGGTVVGLDRDRAFYTAVALAIGTYYLLFAVMGGSTHAPTQEIAAYIVLAALAVTGFRTSLWLVVVALVGHGVFDVFHEELIENDGVPAYWPMFCMSYDVTAGLYLAWLLRRQPSVAPSPTGGHSIGPFVQSKFGTAALGTSAAASLCRLERARPVAGEARNDH